MESTTAPPAGAIRRLYEGQRPVSKPTSLFARRLVSIGCVAAAATAALLQASHWAHAFSLRASPVPANHFPGLAEYILLAGIVSFGIQLNARENAGSISPPKIPRNRICRQPADWVNSKPQVVNKVHSVRVSRVCPSGIEEEARFVISLAAEDGDHVILGTGTGFHTADEALNIAQEIAEFLDAKPVNR